MDPTNGAKEVWDGIDSCTNGSGGEDVVDCVIEIARDGRSGGSVT